MGFDAVIGCVVLLLFLIFVCTFAFQRLRWKRNKRLGKKHPGFYPTFSSLGNSLQRLQQIAIPQVEIVMQEEDAVGDAQDEEEIAKDGIEHLHRQLKKIRNGNEIDKLTVLLRFWRS
jgi:hypothetical protein